MYIKKEPGELYGSRLEVSGTTPTSSVRLYCYFEERSRWIYCLLLSC